MQLARAIWRAGIPRVSTVGRSRVCFGQGLGSRTFPRRWFDSRYPLYAYPCRSPRFVTCLFSRNRIRVTVGRLRLLRRVLTAQGCCTDVPSSEQAHRRWSIAIDIVTTVPRCTGGWRLLRCVGAASVTAVCSERCYTSGMNPTRTNLADPQPFSVITVVVPPPYFPKASTIRVRVYRVRSRAV